MNHRLSKILTAAMVSLLCLSGCTSASSSSSNTNNRTAASIYHSISNSQDAAKATSSPAITLDSIPAYSGSPYAVINNNTPYFSASELSSASFETYSDLDSLGRCQTAYASIGTDIMPTEKRGSIGSVKPTGWHTVKYDTVSGKYLYNRCHLIGYQLAGENANKKNLITGTRYMNVEGMEPFENSVQDYVSETGNHVQYRVTPIFQEDELVARGVLMEAESVEDSGESILFCVYCYNVQPGITIDYATGDSTLTDQTTATPDAAAAAVAPATEKSETAYVLNTNTHKFHRPDCSSIKQMSAANTAYSTESRDQIIAEGYEPCKRCNP